MGAVVVDDRGDDLAAVLERLDGVDGLGPLVDVDVLVRHPVGGQEALHPLAVGTPRRAVDGEAGGGGAVAVDHRRRVLLW